jgi:hypothetical protein
VKLKPKYGAMKIGDPAHSGFNKTFGGGEKSTEYRYVEEREQDPVKYQKDVRNPVWLSTAQMLKSTATKSIISNSRGQGNKAIGYM